jgi:hypothetical protein
VIPLQVTVTCLPEARFVFIEVTMTVVKNKMHMDPEVKYLLHLYRLTSNHRLYALALIFLQPFEAVFEIF